MSCELSPCIKITATPGPNFSVMMHCNCTVKCSTVFRIILIQIDFHWCSTALYFRSFSLTQFWILLIEGLIYASTFINEYFFWFSAFIWVLLLSRVLSVLIIKIYLKFIYIFAIEVIFRNFHFTLEHSETKIEIWKEDKKIWNDTFYFYLLIKTCSHQLSNKAKIWEQEASLDSVLLTINLNMS